MPVIRLELFQVELPSEVEPSAVGDELVVRVELRVDRDMEYVHLKDMRGTARHSFVSQRLKGVT